MNRVQDPFRLRIVASLQLGTRRDLVRRADRDGRRVQVIETVPRDAGGQRLRPRAAFACVRYDQDTSGLPHGPHHRFEVERHERPRVDDLGGQVKVLFETFRRLNRRIKRRADRQDREVVSRALHVGRPERDLVVLLRHTARVEHLRRVVQALTFEKDHGVGPRERRRQHALCIVRRRRIDNLQAGDVRAERGPVLRVLRAVFCPDGHPKDHGHLQHAGRHRLPFRQLVEHLVPGAPYEIAVHELDQRMSAAHPASDRRADDRRLGDRRVEEPVIGHGFRESGVDAVRAAPVPIVLAVDDEPVIGVYPAQDSLEQRVTQRERLQPGDRIARGVQVKPCFSRELFLPRVFLDRLRDVLPDDSRYILRSSVREIVFAECVGLPRRIGTRRDIRVRRQSREPRDMLDNPGVLFFEFGRGNNPCRFHVIPQR